MTYLSFWRLNRRNLARLSHWTGEENWTLADWSNALNGEAGELANFVKKIRRIDTGADRTAGEGKSREELVQSALKELGDVVIYADLLASKLGGSLEDAVVLKFNEVSKRYGFEERL